MSLSVPPIVAETPVARTVSVPCASCDGALSLHELRCRGELPWQFPPARWLIPIMVSAGRAGARLGPLRGPSQAFPIRYQFWTLAIGQACA
jgi:hypothetical protein